MLPRCVPMLCDVLGLERLQTAHRPETHRHRPMSLELHCCEFDAGSRGPALRYRANAVNTRQVRSALASDASVFQPDIDGWWYRGLALLQRGQGAFL